jgi:hypothetical protein
VRCYQGRPVLTGPRCNDRSSRHGEGTGEAQRRRAGRKPDVARHQEGRRGEGRDARGDARDAARPYPRAARPAPGPDGGPFAPGGEGQRYHQVAETQEPFAGDPDDANDHFLLQKGHHLRDAEGEELSSKRKERLADNLRGRAHEAARRSAEANKEAGLTDEAEQDANARQPRKPATADQRAAEGR